MRVRETFWFSTYHVHHRVAQAFRCGRIFLLGDAGRVHSPVGGPGMNTGLMDATNLGWKLAAVLKGEADERLLASYQPERMPFAHLLRQHHRPGVLGGGDVFPLGTPASLCGRPGRVHDDRVASTGTPLRFRSDLTDPHRLSRRPNQSGYGRRRTGG